MNTQKQEQARTLFFQTDLSRTQIAEALGVPRRTLHHWIRQNNWDRQKDSSDIMPSFLAENCYHVINRFTQQLLAAETITYKDADALHKFTLTVNKLKNRSTLNEQMEVFGRFMDAVGVKSPEIAQIISPFVDDYISSQSVNAAGKFQSAAKMPSPKDDSIEQELDRQDLEFWAAQASAQAPADQPVSQEPASDHATTPVAETTSGTDKHTLPFDEKAEAYVEDFKQMFPNFPPEVVQEFREFYHENYTVQNRPTAARAA